MRSSPPFQNGVKHIRSMENLTPYAVQPAMIPTYTEWGLSRFLKIAQASSTKQTASKMPRKAPYPMLQETASFAKEKP